MFNAGRRKGDPYEADANLGTGVVVLQCGPHYRRILRNSASVRCWAVAAAKAAWAMP